MGVSAPTTLVPPARLGQLLTTARDREQRSLNEVAAASGGRFRPVDLLAIEAGERTLGDEELQEVIDLYGVDPGELVPDRSRLIIDFEEGLIRAAEHEKELESRAPTPDEVLTSYLSLVYSMRHRQPGERIPLRVNDMKVLSRALEMSIPAVEDKLTVLMADPDEVVSHRIGLLRKRFLVPAAGVVVAATAVGTLLLVNGRSTTPTQPAPPPPSFVQPSPPPMVGPAVVEEPGGQTRERTPADDAPPGGN